MAGVDGMPRFDLMDIEHEAWLKLMSRLRDRGVEPNHPQCNKLIDQIRYWGETLVALRIADPSHVDTAFAEAKKTAEEGR